MYCIKVHWVLFPFLLMTAIESKSIYEKKMRRNSYDYIVVGAGSTGSVVASRLSEDGQYSVLLLEAGGEPPSITEIPLFCGDLLRTELDWGFYTEPESKAFSGLREQRAYYGAGKVLGGTSTINNMMYVRGNRRGFDDWQNRKGASGWCWGNVLHYFLKSEDMTSPLYRDNGHHGIGGPLTVSVNSFSTPLRDSFIDAAKSLGLEEIDLNGPSQLGVSRVQVNIRGGLRCSTEKAFLKPAAGRQNLDILTHAHVTRVQFDQDKRARWVHFERNNRSHAISAESEIIISAGAINSPQILMLSGIGPKEHLESLNISVISDLPVGENLRDQVTTGSQVFAVNSSVGVLFDRDIGKKEMGDLIGGKGPLTSIHDEALAYFNTKYADVSKDWPDIEIHFVSAVAPDSTLWNEKAQKLVDPFLGKDGFTMLPVLLRPKSQGYLKLRSTNPHDRPIIQPRVFTDENDLKVLVEGMKFAEEMVRSPPFQRLGPVRILETVPGCEGMDKSSDSYLACAAQTVTQPVMHQCCTCKMGDTWDPSTVVDSELRVKGVKNLRVADASIMPNLISSKLNAACIMIGEKVADLIRGRKWDSIQQKIVFF